MIVSGNEETVVARFTQLKAPGLDELYVGPVPITDADKNRIEVTTRAVNIQQVQS